MNTTDNKYEALFTPWKIGNVEIKNRIVMCPMGGTSLFGWFELTGCHFDKEAAKLFLERAKNNVGLIIPGIAPLRDTFWGKWLWQNKKMFEDLKVFMDEIHKTGAKLFIQLTAGMGRSWAITELVAPLHKNKFTRAILKPILDTSHELASPSPQKSRWAHDIECPEMTVEQIHEIIEAFAKTAKLCKEAGVDGVEVHAVHEGYLLDQFAIEFFNKRTDDYGGSFENRYRFAAEVVKAIKEECGQDYPVSLGLFHITSNLDVILTGHRALTESLHFGLYGITERNGIILSALLLDSLYNLGSEAVTVLEASAVIIGSLVEELDSKLV